MFTFEGDVKSVYPEVCNKAFSYCCLICAGSTAWLWFALAKVLCCFFFNAFSQEDIDLKAFLLIPEKNIK